MRILVTRPAPECALTAQKLRDLGHEAVEMPLLQVRFLTPDLTDLASLDAVAVTSGRALTALAKLGEFSAFLSRFRDLPIFCVGGKTADRARALGFRNLRSADGNVEALSKLILSCEDVQSVLYVAAEDRSGDLEGELSRAGRRCEVVEVYRTELVESLPEKIISDLAQDRFDAVLIYSARTATALRSCLSSLNIPMGARVLALSPKAGQPLSDLVNVEIAAHPDEASLFKLLLSDC